MTTPRHGRRHETSLPRLLRAGPNKSSIHIWVHKYASYLTETKSRSHAGGYDYFSNKTKLPIQYDYPPPKHNNHIIVLSKIIDAVTSFNQESETGGCYINTKKALPIR